MSIVSVSKARGERRPSLSRMKPVLYPEFQKATEYENDSYWKQSLLNASYGDFSNKHTVYQDGRLSRKDSTIQGVRLPRDDPEGVARLFVAFHKKYERTLSDKELEQEEYKRQEICSRNVVLTWGVSNIQMKRAALNHYAMSQTELRQYNSSLEKEKAMRQFSAILMTALELKLLNENTILMKDNVIDHVSCVKKQMSNSERSVRFEEAEHKYFIDDVAMSRSVTQLVGQFFPHFNSTVTATKMLNREDFSSLARYEQYRVILRDANLVSTDPEAVDLIVSFWDQERDEAARLGTLMHKSIEAYYSDRTVPDPLTKEFSLFSVFDAYTQKAGYVPYKSEQIVHDVGLSLAGSCDMLYVKKTDLDSRPLKAWLVDWKRSKQIKMTSFDNKKGTGPFSQLEDCNFQHYSVQLNLYKCLLERHFGMQIEKMSLVILHPKQARYMMYHVSCLQAEVKEALATLESK